MITFIYFFIVFLLTSKSVSLPCFISCDFLNWYFQPIRIKDLIQTWLEKQKGGKILQEFCKNYAKTAKVLQKYPAKPPDGADPNKLSQYAPIITSQFIDLEQLLWRNFKQNRKILQKIVQKLCKKLCKNCKKFWRFYS